jgi:hypothetical protein
MPRRTGRTADEMGVQREVGDFPHIRRQSRSQNVAQPTGLRRSLERQNIRHRNCEIQYELVNKSLSSRRQMELE